MNSLNQRIANITKSGDKIKNIPLSEAMGGDNSCCVHNAQCIELVKNIKNKNIKFRCPLMVEVDDDVEFAGEWHESCTLE